MENIAKLLTGYLVKNKSIMQEDYEICKYGLLTGIEIFVCVIVCYAIAICLDMFRECTVLLLLFFSLRSFVGGLHMSSFNACFVCSCTVVSLILIMVKYCSLPKVISVFISACGIAIIFFLKPVENKNRPTEALLRIPCFEPLPEWYNYLKSLSQCDP